MMHCNVQIMIVVLYKSLGLRCFLLGESKVIFP